MYLDYKPDEQRYADCDEFLCPKCGLHLAEWTQLVYDEENQVMDGYEYTFRYCPECGEKMVSH